MKMFDVELLKVSKSFGQVLAVDNVSLQVRTGEFLTLLGPSGCGKTTILKIIAGLEEPTAGTVMIRGEIVNGQPPYARDCSLMFQSYALFPHKNVFDNIAFGLKYRGVSKREREKKLREILELVHLPGIEDRYPRQLSGGQQQRVALARSLVVNPAVLLLDEPLSSLDQKLREGMRVELKQIQERAGITFIFVTHDQEEALTLSDRIVVMNQGKVVQVGTSHEVYERPNSRFVAEFMGESNFLDVTLHEASGEAAILVTDRGMRMDLSLRGWTLSQSRLTVQIRAERIRVFPEKPTGPRNCFAGRVERLVYEGNRTKYYVRLVSGELLVAAESSKSTGRIDRDSEIWLTFEPEDCVLLNA